MNLNELTPAQVAEIREAGGFSGSVKDGIKFGGEEATAFSPAASHPISGYKTDIRPVIRDVSGEAIEQARVLRPNLDKHLAAHEAANAKLAAEELARREELDENRAWMQPEKLRAEIEYLTRTVKRLERNLSKLSKGVKTDGE